MIAQREHDRVAHARAFREMYGNAVGVEGEAERRALRIGGRIDRELRRIEVNRVGGRRHHDEPRLHLARDAALVEIVADRDPLVEKVEGARVHGPDHGWCVRADFACRAGRLREGERRRDGGERQHGDELA